MKYCAKCRIYVLGNSGTCPLCFSGIENAGTEPEDEAYPDIRRKKGKKRALLLVLLSLSAAGILACVFVNLREPTGILWSLIVVTALFLLWETAGFMFLSKKNIGWRLLAQLLAVMLVLITIDAVTGWNGWSVGYIAPFVIAALTFAMTVIFYVNRAKWREYMIFQLVIAMNGFIPVILYWCGLTGVLWPAAAGALYALLTFTGMLLFTDKQLKNELMKRFHL